MKAAIVAACFACLLLTASAGANKPTPGQARRHLLQCQEYTIQPGDGLWAIAQKFGTTPEQVQKDNNIANPNLIQAGAKLKICGGGAAPIPSGSGSNPPQTSGTSGGSCTYVIQPGDGLWAIAQKFGTTPEKLQKDNNIANPNLIQAGATLKVC